MADENTNGNAPAEDVVVEDVVVETPDEPADVLDAPVIGEEGKDETAEEGEVVAEELVPEPPIFTPEMETTEFAAKAGEVLEKYDLETLPPDIKAVIDASLARAQVEPADPMVEYSAYGTTDEVKELLDRQAALTTFRAREDGQGLRPNTDQLATSLADLAKTQKAAGQDGTTADWLFYDLGHTPSVKYQGHTRLEEHIIDTLYTEGDTTATVLARYNEFVPAMKANALPSSDIPEFVPKEVREAYSQLPKLARDRINALDPSNEYDADTLQGELKSLSDIQRGLDSDRRDAQRNAQDARFAERAFNENVQAKQNTFFKAFRETFAKDLSTEVKFSDDANQQQIHVARSIALLTEALDPSYIGDAARQTLEAVGIQFDHAKAQQLLKDIENASISVAQQERLVGADGKPINKIEYGKAAEAFTNAGMEWQRFAKNIIDQEARLTSTGKAKDVETAVEKKKVEVKARPATKGTASATAKKSALEPPPHIRYASPEWDKWWANKTREEQAAKAALYQQ